MKELFSLIGRPLGHSFSADYFNEKFSRENIDARYELWPLETIDVLKKRLVENPEIVGFNVTIPYKREVIRFLNDISPEAEKAGAVNCVKVSHTPDGMTLKGFNTDIIGFETALCEFIGENDMRRIKGLVLGSGGAASAVSVALDSLGIDHSIVSRSKGSVSGKFGNTDIVEYADLTPEFIYEHKLIVNTTPLGTFPRVMAAPPFPWEYLSSRHYFFDLIYNPEETLAMRIAKAHGAKVCNGLRMLHAQADAAWEIWQNESSANR